MPPQNNEQLENSLSVNFVLTTNYIRFGLLGALLVIALPAGSFFLSPHLLFTNTMLGLFTVLAQAACFLVIRRLAQNSRLAPILATTLFQILLDIITITGLIQHTGGLLSPFPLLYIFPFLYAGMIFSRSPKIMLVVAALVTLFYVGLLAGEYYQFFPVPILYPELTTLYRHGNLILTFALFIPLLFWGIGLFGGLAAVTLRRSRLTAQAELSEEVQKLKSELGMKLEETNEEMFAQNQRLAASEKRSAATAVQLQAAEERFRLIFEYAPDAYYLSDLQGRFLDGNRAAEKLVGRSRSEVIGKSFSGLNLLPLGQLPAAAGLLGRNALGQPTGPDEFTLIRADGTKVPVEISTFPIKLGERPVVLGIARDITERRKQQQALIAHTRELEIFNAIILAGNQANNLTALIKAALIAIVQNLGFSGGGLYLIEPDGRTASLKYSIGLKPAFTAAVQTIPIDQPLYKTLFFSGQPVLLPNYALSRPDRAKLDEIGAVASFPLLLKDRVIGALNLADKNPRDFSPEEIKLFSAIGREVGAQFARLQTEEQLRERLVEIEKMNRFMIGRENDMIELKREINQLLQQNGQPARYHL